MLVVDVAAQAVVRELTCCGEAVPNRVLFTRHTRELICTDNYGLHHRGMMVMTFPAGRVHVLSIDTWELIRSRQVHGTSA